MEIPKRLQQLRRLSGMTQEEVAARVGLTRQAISSYESGRTHPDVEMLTKLATLYDTDLYGILYGSSAQQKWDRAIRTTAWTGTGTVLLFVLVRSILIFLVNVWLPVSKGGPSAAGADVVLPLRFSLLEIGQLLGGLSQGAAFISCLILAVLLTQRLPRLKKAVLWLTSFLGAFLACTVPFAAFDRLYTYADYLLISIGIFLPAVLLLAFWAGLALFHSRKRSG